ncbi:MAG: hypothetical protein LBJ08_05175 [Bifidobacteriaceae bacterium]|jgi:hypothetical protein|nr:hypothetical protein [Bifidobacteriaceae bacterium]
MKRFRTGTALLAVAATVTLGACGADDDVASLSGSAGGSEGESQAARAATLVACLHEGGVPATLVDYDKHQKDIGFDKENPYAIGYGDGSGASFVGRDVTTDEQWAAVERHQGELVMRYDPASGEAMIDPDAPAPDATIPPPAGFARHPYLFIGDADHTDLLIECLRESDYTPPVYQVDPAEELEQEQRTAGAGVQWAACARDNGFPDVKDPDAPLADNNETTPTVLLPASITEPQLRDPHVPTSTLRRPRPSTRSCAKPPATSTTKTSPTATRPP